MHTIARRDGRPGGFSPAPSRPGRAGLGALAALALPASADALNALTAAVLLGVVVRALHPLPGWAQAGTAFARRTLLQLGIVLLGLGLELSVGELRELGAPTLVMVGVVVALTFVVTRWTRRLAGLPEAMSLFIASLGASLDLRPLAVTGRRAAAVGLASWGLVAGTSLVGLHLVT